MFRLVTRLALTSAAIYRYYPQVHYASRAMGRTLKYRTTNWKYKTAYPKVTMEEAEKRLGFMFNDLVLAIIMPIVIAFKSKTGRDLRLQREKESIAVDSKTGGYEEFAMVDMIGVGNRKFVFLVEAKKSSLGEGKRQCLLAMKDMGDRNGGGLVYGFATTGEQWQMLRPLPGTDGRALQVSQDEESVRFLQETADDGRAL
ncbi:hypothetical protein HOY80DRAFT_1137754 [Tuber brumale]|nr:hypothetical protein HOY80DRAFT_1137754 [Tuber brumale]